MSVSSLRSIVPHCHTETRSHKSTLTRELVPCMQFLIGIGSLLGSGEFQLVPVSHPYAFAFTMQPYGVYGGTQYQLRSPFEPTDQSILDISTHYHPDSGNLDGVICGFSLASCFSFQHTANMLQSIKKITGVASLIYYDDQTKLPEYPAASLVPLQLFETVACGKGAYEQIGFSERVAFTEFARAKRPFAKAQLDLEESADLENLRNIFSCYSSPRTYRIARKFLSKLSLAALHHSTSYLARKTPELQLFLQAIDPWHTRDPQASLQDIFRDTAAPDAEPPSRNLAHKIFTRFDHAHLFSVAQQLFARTLNQLSYTTATAAFAMLSFVYVEWTSNDANDLLCFVSYYCSLMYSNEQIEAACNIFLSLELRDLKDTISAHFPELKNVTETSTPRTLLNHYKTIDPALESAIIALSYEYFVEPKELSVDIYLKIFGDDPLPLDLKLQENLKKLIPWYIPPSSTKHVTVNSLLAAIQEYRHTRECTLQRQLFKLFAAQASSSDVGTQNALLIARSHFLMHYIDRKGLSIIDSQLSQYFLPSPMATRLRSMTMPEQFIHYTYGMNPFAQIPHSELFRSALVEYFLKLPVATVRSLFSHLYASLKEQFPQFDTYVTVGDFVRSLQLKGFHKVAMFFIILLKNSSRAFEDSFQAAIQNQKNEEIYPLFQIAKWIIHNKKWYVL